jgi:DNA polymerase-3 subunit alpha
LESLIKTGACDCFGQTRATLFVQIERTMARAASILSDKQKGQSSLFGALEEKATPMPEAISNLPEWPQHELLAHEKELLGFYVTGHPLTPLVPLLEKYSLTNTAKLAELPNRSMTRIGGMIAAVTHGFSKKSGKPYSMVTLEDLEGSVQLLVMNDYDKFRPLLEANKAILVIGEVSTGEDKPKIFPQEILPLTDAPKKYTKQVHLRLHSAHLQPDDMLKAQQLVGAHTGKCPLFLCFMRPDGGTIFVGTHEKFSVMPSLALEHAANKLFGEETYYAKVDTSLPEKARRSWEKKNGSGGGEE